MQLEKNRRGRELRVVLSGELDHHNAAIIREEVDRELDGSVKLLTLDMSGITFMDSSGIELTDIRTAISEAVTNAILHGYGNDPTQKVYMRCTAEDRLLTFEIEDKGKGIENVALAMQPFYTTEPNLERSGMGFSVMEAFMDDVRVESEPGNGTRVTMTKSILAVREDE